METNELKDALRRIANTAANELTAEDKELIEQTVAEYGVKLRRKGCNSCYIDAAVELYSKIEGVKEDDPEGEQEQEAENSPKYVLKKGVDVLVNGVRVCEATMTDGLAKYLLSIGFDRKYFSKLQEDEA